MKFSTFALLSLPLVFAENDGFGRLPLMGYNTYNDADCIVNTTFIEGRINDLVDTGLSKLGYKIFQIDCGWQGYQRQSNGSITYDASVFPTGIRPLSQMAISKGLTWGMYTDQGVYACDTSVEHRPGSLGHEYDDALMFAAWNAAYVKVDNCWITSTMDSPHTPLMDLPARYQNMSTALQSVGIKGMLVCEWGVAWSSPTGLQGPAQWTPALATSFRVSDDISDIWESVLRIVNEAINVNLRRLSGPGQFADMDLLEVGNPGMTVYEQATHFALWAIFKSSLFISTNIHSMSEATKNILMNENVIAINQDPLAKPATLVQRYTSDHDVYMGPLANGDKVVMLFDQTNANRTLSINFADLGIKSATAKDLWSNKVTDSATSYSKAVGPHDQLLLRLSNIVYNNAGTCGAPGPSMTYYTASSGTLSGGAVVQSCTGCSTGKDVGYLNSTSSVTISNIRTSQATSNVLFDYVNCEIAFLNMGDTNGNVRYAEISVNNGAPQNVSFPISGYDWSTDVLKDYKVQLTGFSTTQPNTIRISGSMTGSGYAPDIDRFAVVN